MNVPGFGQSQSVTVPVTRTPAKPAARASRPRHAKAKTKTVAHARLAAGVLAAGLVLIALNLRLGVASVGPVLPRIRAGLGLPAAAASLLTTIPVVAFGVFAFLAPWLTRRLGMRRLLGMTMALLTAGILLRLQPSLASLFGGTVIVGAAIAVANVVMPAVIKHEFPHRVGLSMGLYSTALFLGAAIADGLTVPLLPLAGGQWRSALAFWAIPAAAAVLLWFPQFFRRPDSSDRHHGADRGHGAGQPSGAAGAGSAAGEPSFRAILTDPVAIAVTVLMGVQSMGYYVTLTWLPTLLNDHGLDPHTAGWMLSYSAFPGIVASLASPALARRIRPTWVPIALSVAVDAIAYAGLAVAPVPAAYLWMTLLGLGQGASISLSLTYVAWRSPDASHTAHVSTMAQGFGYLLASLGPLGIGAVRAASGGWGVPLIVLAALLVPQLVAGILASRERHVLEPRTRPVPSTTGPSPAAPWNAAPWATRPDAMPPSGTVPPTTGPPATGHPATPPWGMWTTEVLADEPGPSLFTSDSEEGYADPDQPVSRPETPAG